MEFNGHNFNDLLKVEEIERSFLPPIQNYSKQIPGKVGAYFNRTEVGIGIIRIKVRLIEDSRIAVQEKMREISGKLYTEKPAKLLLRDDHRYNMAVISGLTSVDKFLFTGYGEIEFECHDPYAYEPEKKVNIGTTFNNKGSAPSTGIINIVATTSTKMIVKADNQLDVLTIIYPFKGEEKVLIDLEKQLITINGTNSMKYLSLDSDFFEIPCGDKQKINVTGGTGTITYRERWL